jgi:hypothetical protein
MPVTMFRNLFYISKCTLPLYNLSNFFEASVDFVISQTEGNTLDSISPNSRSSIMVTAVTWCLYVFSMLLRRRAPMFLLFEV